MAATGSPAVIAIAALAVYAAVTGASAITTKSSAAPAVIKTSLQIFPPDDDGGVGGGDDYETADDRRQNEPSFAARYWQREVAGNGPSPNYGDVDEYDPAPPHKLSAVQQTHILDDIRRHNLHQQTWTSSPPSSSTTEAATRGAQPGDDRESRHDDRLQQLLQINGVAAADVQDRPDDNRHGRQKPVAAGDWHPQPPPPQLYNRQPQQQSPSLSPYVSPPPPQYRDAQQQHYATPASPDPTAVQPQHRHQPQQLFVTAPSPQQQYYPVRRPAGDDVIDADVEHQIRQQLTAVMAAGGGGGGGGGGNNNSHAVTDSSAAGNGNRSHQSAASNQNVQYVQIGSGNGAGSSSSRNRAQLETGAPAAGHRNTVVKTVVVRQKPPAPSPAPAPAPSPPQQPWTVSEQQQLEQLARQVLPPGVAQYEIIRAGGVDGTGANVVADDSTAAAAAAATTVNAQPSAPTGDKPLASSTGGKKKPVTFVILEERPDGTVRVRGIEKKQHGDAPPDSGPVAADDEQLQQLVDKLNRGELRLPAGPPPPASNAGRTDSAAVASSTTASSGPVPSYAAPSKPSSVAAGGGGSSSNKYRDPPVSPYFPTASPAAATTAAAAVSLSHPQFQDFFVPTVVAPVTTTAGAGQQQRHHHHQQYYTPPAITAPASSSTQSPTINSTLSRHDHSDKAAKDGAFSSVLRRRGYYAMAKYMRQAGIDAVLEETGPFTVFVPTDKAFRALLVQLGGPDRAEDKFRENPRLLIGLLLHHVVPGAFKVVDLRAGDEMTGVSLAGTQLRANLYARQIYDNRWNDIEVLTVNGARVLDDVSTAASAGIDDSSAFEDGLGGSTQQRRDMVLSSGHDEGAGNQRITAIAHAVDRVLFPLPVGDALATMRADRQRRYSVFLRAIDEYCSPSVRALLSGSRTLTVFAPMDEAFRTRRSPGNFSNSGSIVDRLFQDDYTGGGRYKKHLNSQRIADRFVLSHVVMAGVGDPPMYTAGLRFYQVRDTAYRLRGFSSGGDSAAASNDDDGTITDDDGEDGNLTSPQLVDGEKPRYYQLTVYKDSGRIRLNGGAAQVLVRNVPVTNGVLHGLDASLV